MTEGLTTAQYETIEVDWPREHVLCVTLNRPAFSNALNTQMGKELGGLFTALAQDPGEARCVIITGAGERAFCAGGDLKERDGMTNDQWLAQHVIFERFFFCLGEFPLPVIGAVNGHAYGGGFEMIAAMDFAYGVPKARFALTEVTLGIMPGGGSTQHLPRGIGPRRAKEIILTGRPITAQQALEYGVLNRLCEPEDLMDAVLETAGFIAGNAPLAIRQAKKAIHHGQQTDITRGLWFEIESYNRLVFTEDRLEGVRAYNEKRPAKFPGPLMARARHDSISATLGGEIAAGAYPVGSRLPTEMQLQARFGTSRHTVREALKTLSEQGLLARRPKIGTIVRADRPLPVYTHSVRDAGGLVEFAGTTQLDVAYDGFVTANRQLAETLDQAQGTRWLRLAGLRRMHGRPEPLCWSEIYVPADLVADRAAVRAHSGPVYEWVMDARGLKLGHVEQEVQAVTLSVKLAPLLETEPGSPALMVRRLYVAQTGEGFEISLNLYPADRYAMRTVIRPRG